MPTPTPPADPVLAAEQSHLEHARAQLVRMREHTLSLQASGGDAIAEDLLAATLRRRAQALRDDPATTLFFGRLDLLDDGGTTRWYVGRRHVSDAEGDPVVLDWRAPSATPFYRASRTNPHGVLLRRRFGVDAGRLTAYEDEHLLQAEAGDVDGPGASALLAREIERPRSGPMRDIVATIQPEQDEIVRSDLATTVCVQGGPGTGKTAVGLHRAAWLLYTHRDRLVRTGVLVVGPSAAFLEHVGAVLPALGEVQVRHTTAEPLVAREGRVVRAVDSPRAAALKGSAAMAQVLRRALRAGIDPDSEALVVPRGSRRWRVPAYQVRETVQELQERAVRYDAARAMLPRRLAHAVLVQMEAAGDSPDDRVQDAIARSRPVRELSARCWPAVRPETLLSELLSDPAVLAEHAEGLLTEDQQRLVRWARRPRGPRSARWSEADLVLLDELDDLLERTPSLGHVVLDEAQDLSPMQLRAVGRRASTGSLTVLGDVAQGTTPWATASWEESLRHLGVESGAAHLEVLDVGFRVPSAVLEYASRLLPRIAPGLAAARSVRTDPGRLDLLQVAPGSTLPALADAVERLTADPGTVGVVVAEDQVAPVSGVLHRRGIAHEVLGEAGRRGDVGASEGGNDMRTGHGRAVVDTAGADPGRDGDGANSGPGHPAGSPAAAALPERVQLVPAREAKGLEFDQVAVLEPSSIAAAEPDERTGLRRLYVVLTRAVSGLTVVHADPLPDALAP